MDIKERLAALRAEMKKSGTDVYIVPTSDFHRSEFTGEYFKAREYITGFTGSAGTALITQEEALLWTDGRYFIQAEKQLEGSGIILMKEGEREIPAIHDYVDSILTEGCVLGFDGRTLSLGEGRIYRSIAEKNGSEISCTSDLIDRIWKDRPKLSKKAAFRLDEKYSGESVQSKLHRIRLFMKEKGADIHILTTLDDICWTLNIRGDDAGCSPLVLSYAIISHDSVELYIDSRKLNDELTEQLQKEGVRLKPYNNIYEDTANLTAVFEAEALSVIIDPDRVNYAIYSSIPEEVRILEIRNPEVLMKAIKNETEIENIRKAQIKDSIAHIRFMKWLKENAGKTAITEISASEKLDEFRKKTDGYIKPSFDPISAYGEHGAIVHYSADRKTDAAVKEGSLLLMDTGAGYLEGSTDITRTYAIGEIPKEMKEHFTITAAGNLRLASAGFPEGCSGMALDVLARKPFWDRNLNYNHSTGHGVGYLLNIHEDPAGFRWIQRDIKEEPLKEGMVITDEPGIYIEGSHGVRLENELLCRRGEDNRYGQFMYFEILTYVPFDLDAIAPEILTSEDRELLNSYHAEVYRKISPYLDEDEKLWLRKYTEKI